MSRGHVDELDSLEAGPDGRASDGLAALSAALWRRAGGASGVDRIVAATGPGAFAGVRAAVGFARGLSAATGVASVGVDDAAALLVDLSHHEGAATDMRFGVVFGSAARPIWRVAGAFDARRGDASAPAAFGLTAPDPSDADLWAGPGAAPEGSAIVDAPRPSVATFLRLGASRDPASPPSPVYGRPPDAEPSTRSPPPRLP